MPRADVVVIGAGLSGLSCAAELAEGGARVFLAAKGMATTHWTHGGLDVAAPAGARTLRDGIATLAGARNHPYRTLATDAEASVAAHLARTATEGLEHAGSLDSPLVPIPTAIGSLRPAAILPAAQAAVLGSWAGERLLLVGFAGYRDAWAAYAARNLRHADWPGGPSEIRAADVELPELEQRHNIAPQVLARMFEDPAWRTKALSAISAAMPGDAWRIGMPAVLGLDAHAAVHAATERALGSRVFEIPSLPPSVPGMRLFEALRRRILGAAGRIQIGFDVVDVERTGNRVVAIHTEAASRTLRIAADAFVLASGGIGGAGIRAGHDGALTERVFGLPVSAPSRELWFSDDPLRPHPLEAAGIEVDANLTPRELENVRVIGSALAGMHYLDERCGDGVALASAHRAAVSLASNRAVAA
ncbi:MAG TPA: anaerobic glycerol-3-phosphate dehydrogenase subunit GlpB [Candidatus Limnocylindrales bacterium]|nr:anaerobic glycerol-3-phosphate dehydrogenase subunit GlpB [Candidatus Limnocylindrales bacterium]